MPDKVRTAHPHHPLKSEIYRQARLTVPVLLSPLLAFFGTRFRRIFVGARFDGADHVGSPNPPWWPLHNVNAASFLYVPELLGRCIGVRAVFASIRLTYYVLLAAGMLAILGTVLTVSI